MEFEESFDFNVVASNVIGEYINKSNSVDHYGSILFLLPRRRKTLYLNYGEFMVRPLIVIVDDLYYIEPSKNIVNYLSDGGDRVKSIVLSVIYNNKKYHVELFRNGRVVFSPKSIGVENVKKLINKLYSKPDGYSLV